MDIEAHDLTGNFIASAWIRKLWSIGGYPIACFVVVLIVCTAPRLSAEEICIVRGLDFSIYQEVVDGFWKQLGKPAGDCDQTLKGKEAETITLIKNQSPKVVLALGSTAITFLAKNFPDIPMVFGMTNDSNATGKATGVLVDVTLQEQVNLVRQAIPELKRVGVIYSVSNKSLADQFKRVAEGAGLTVNAHAINSPNEALGVITNFKGDDLMWLLPDQGVMTSGNRDDLFKEAENLALKVYAFSPTYLKGSASADLSVSIDWPVYGAQIADLMKKVLASPGQKFSVETPREARIYFKKGRKGFNINIPNARFIP